MRDEAVDRDVAYVEDILDSVQHIQRYVAGVEPERFVGDSMLVVHRDWAVDLAIVWRIVSVDVPALGTLLRNDS